MRNNLLLLCIFCIPVYIPLKIKKRNVFLTRSISVGVPSNHCTDRMIKPGHEYELKDPPTDGISSVRFGPCSDSLLLSSSWDSNVYLHDAVENRKLAEWSLKSPILDCTFSHEASFAYAGSLKNEVIQLDLNTVQNRTLGCHEDAVKCVNTCRMTGLLFSGSWDRSLGGWDHRSAKPRIHHQSLPAKVYSMDVCQNVLVVAMADRHVWIFDTRRMGQPLQRRESSLKYMTRCVRAFPSGEGYVCTSVEGRVAVDFVDASDEAQEQKYAFKCHRSAITDQENMENVYPVNAAAFHPTYGTFATGGADSVVNFWDRINRKRIRQLPKYHSSISSLSFNRDGQLLAIASSYGYEEGEKDHHPDSIFVRAIEDSDIKPKSL